MPTIYMIATLLNKIVIFGRANWFLVLIFLLAHFSQFWPVYFQGFLPFPGDMLVAFYFPWSGGGFLGFDPWTQYKALNTVDVIKQFYPWKAFIADALHNGFWPSWNPYNFAGMPLIANLQSALFFPVNFVYLFLPVLWGWVSNVIFQILVFGVFFYLFLRSENLSKLSSAFGAIAAMNMSYIALWHWQLVITQSVLFFPLILRLINKYKILSPARFLVFNSILLSFCFFGGHVQTVVYVYLVFVLFALFRGIPIRLVFLSMLLAGLLSGIQLFPSIEAYFLSAREGETTKKLFGDYLFPWSNLITAIAPDYFGHPTTRNYTGIDYRDMNIYFGLTALIFALSAVIRRFHDSNVRFFLFLALLSFIFSSWPFAWIFNWLGIPVLSSSTPARLMFLFQFSGVVLAAYGFDLWFKKRIFSAKALLIIGLILLSLWFVAFSDGNRVAKSNLVIPTILVLITGPLVLIRSRITVLLLFTCVFWQYAYFFHKYNSFAPEKFVFPKHPVLSYLQKNGGVNRFFGTEHAILDQNFATYYKIFDFKGYDSMYLRRYGELLAAAQEGAVPNIIPRSDAYLSRWSDTKSERLLDILGVKYLLDKDDGLQSDWDEEPMKFPTNKYRLLWQRRPWRIYERTTAISRVLLFGDYLVEKDSREIIKKIYDEGFDYSKVLILEKDPQVVLDNVVNQGDLAEIVSYTPNRIRVKTGTKGAKLLFFSDNYYPGWRAFIDNKEVEILRANYTFRAIILPPGIHEVVFIYDPWTIKAGLIVSLATLIFLGVLWQKNLQV